MKNTTSILLTITIITLMATGQYVTSTHKNVETKSIETTTHMHSIVEIPTYEVFIEKYSTEQILGPYDVVSISNICMSELANFDAPDEVIIEEFA